MKHLIAVTFLLSAVCAQAADFKSTTRSKENKDGTVTTWTRTTGDGVAATTKTTVYKNGNTSTTTTLDGKPTTTSDNGAAHVETVSKAAGATTEQAEEAAKKHKFCQQNPNHQDCKKTAGDSKLFEPDEDIEGRDPFILR